MPIDAAACRRCGAPLTGGVPGGLCAVCFGGGLFSDGLLEPALSRIGDYELAEEIGRGGMGVVYRARQSSLGRAAAVKLILTGPLASTVERQRFVTEASAAAALEHPGIVAVYDAGEEDGQPFYAMQLVEGESLWARLAGGGKFGAREAASLIRSLALAVQHAHERGFLHRDLKPANILLDAQGAPHIADFGLARRVDDDSRLTLTGAAVGTPSYMAPEQMDTRQPPTTAVDIYSLGAILYEMLSGRPPFAEKSLPELFVAIREKQPQALTLASAAVDRDLDVICRKCLEKNPAHRYASAQQLADDLQRWLDGEPIAARAASRAERLWRWCRRRPGMAALAAVAAVSFLGGLAGVLWQWNRAEREAHAARLAYGRADVSARDARRALYAADMNLCQAALNNNNLGRARRLLDAHRPAPGGEDLRGWEWRYLWAQCRSRASAVLRPAGRAVWGVTATGYGPRVFTHEDDGTLREFEAATCTQVKKHRYNFDKGPLIASPDGCRFIAPMSAQTAEIWEAASASVLSIPTTARLVEAAWSPDGTRVALQCEDGRVRLCDAANGALLHEWKLEKVSFGHGGALAFLPGDPVRLAVGDGAHIRIFRCGDGTLEREWLAHPGNGLASLAASPDGRWLASSACYQDSTVRIWDAANGQDAARLEGHVSWISTVLFSRDGAQLFTAGADQMVGVWETAGWTQRAMLRGHSDEIWSLSLAGDGLVSGAKNGEVLLWSGHAMEAASARFVFPPETHEVLDAGTHLIALRPGYVTRWEPGSWRRGEECALPGGDMKYTPGALLFIRRPDGKTKILDAALAPPEEIAVIEIPEVLSMIAMPDDSVAVLLHEGGHFTIVDRRTRQTRRVNVSGTVRTFGFRPEDGHLLVWTSAPDGTHAFHRCELSTGAWLPPQSVSAAPAGFRSDWRAEWMVRVNGRHLTVARAHPFQQVLELDQENGVPSQAFSRDSRWLAVANENAWVRLWPLPASGTLPEPVILRGHLNSVHSVTFTPDSTRLATLCSNREAAKLWDPVTGHEMLTLAGDATMLYYARFTRDGTTLLASRPGKGNTWQAWHAPSLDQIAAAEKIARW